MCKTMTDLCIQSARVQHFSAFIITVVVVLLLLLLLLLLLGVYPRNADNSKYVNFIYVGGGQNPKADPVHKGTLQLIAVLPNGLYDVRYL